MLVKTITVSPSQAGSHKLLLPEFEGRKIKVFRRGLGQLTEDEFTSIAAGGFELVDTLDIIQVGEVFVVEEVVSTAYSLGSYNPAQYPHTLKSNILAEGEKDENGNYTEGESIVSELPCRAESSTGDGYITSSDGVKVDYSWVAYFPLSTPDIVQGSNVEILSGTTLLCKDTIKRFSRGTFNCRAWL